jgi:hypothetical protein
MGIEAKCENLADQISWPGLSCAGETKIEGNTIIEHFEAFD